MIPAASATETDALLGFVREHARLFVLTGAGVSTGSGIPDYRDDEGRWKRKPPVTLQEFLGSEAVRRRYWARSMIGWPTVAGARPNAAHDALARLEAASRVHRLVTQNVDGLHQRAGNARVIELHGSIGAVACVDCRVEVSRERVQEMLAAANPGHVRASATTAPDGDADLEPDALARFAVPPCPSCGGILKPCVVFLGDTVPRERVGAAMAALDEADAVLVLGSSLMMYSGYRFCERARATAKPIAAINLGRTRADHLFQVKVERPCEEALVELLEGLSRPESPPNPNGDGVRANEFAPTRK